MTARMIALLLAVVTVVTSIATAPHRSAAQGGLSRPILYSDFDESSQEFVTSAVYPDGRQSKGVLPAWRAAWSPDGNWIAYVTVEPDKTNALKLRNLRDDEKTLFETREEHLWNVPTWSPDGGRLAIIALQPRSNGPFTNRLLVIDVSTGKVLARHDISDGVIHLPYFYTPPNIFRWSPDGRMILLSWESAVVIDVASGRSETINPGPTIAEWAPDSSGIYYFTIRNPRQIANRTLGEFYFKKLGSGNPVTLLDAARLRALDLAYSPLVFGRMALSPSGKQLAVSIGSTKHAQGVLQIYDLSAGPTSVLGKMPKVFEPRGVIIGLEWAPDESNLAAMTGGDDVRIELLDLSAGTWKTLATVVETKKVDIDSLAFVGLSWSH
jgi:Tol biopolymer transport system component